MTNIPVRGAFTVTTYNGYKMSNGKIHAGIDITTAANNRTLYSVCVGTVTKVQKLTTSYGYHIYIKDIATGNTFIMAHFQEIHVSEGQPVDRNTVVGIMGQTGNATGPHVHIEMKNSSGTLINGQLAGYLGFSTNTPLGNYNTANFQLDLPNITYKTHCQNYGWRTDKENGAMAGAYAEGLRIEAVIMNADIPIQYRVHMEGIGWGPWVPNNCMAGTTGENRRIEAIEIQSSKTPFVGQGYVENIGFQNAVTGTQIVIGTTGQGLRLEGFRICFIK